LLKPSCVACHHAAGSDAVAQLDVRGVHGVGGIIGVVALGVFGSVAVNPAGADGLIFGGSTFFVKQVVAVVGASIYAFVFSYVMLILINKVTPVRVSEAEEMGLDEKLHGETAYVDGQSFDS